MTVNASIPLKKWMTDRNTWTTASKVTLEKIFSWESDISFDRSNIYANI